MHRRTFLKQVAAAALLAPGASPWRAAETTAEAQSTKANKLDPALARDWLTRWERHLLAEARTRYCDREMGEEIGWLISLFLYGFYYGYRATGEAQWVERLVDWADAWLKRGVEEPDGYLGWPKSGTGGVLEQGFYSDSMLGEAMGLRPVVLMAHQILSEPALQERYGAKAKSYLKLAEQVYEKWVARGCWRQVKEGGLWVVPAFGIDRQSGKWTEGYAQRNQDGFSHPANKQNHIARWLMTMHDLTGKAVYQEKAQRWWQLMKSRMRTRENGKYFVWNYWDPAGPWDYYPDGSPRHWVGVHANGGYYEIDVSGIVSAFDHGLVFTREELQRLVATNRDFMWNHQVHGARFQRIDGREPDPRWKDSPGTLWTPLIPYDPTLREIFVANYDPTCWGGLVMTPWFMALEKGGDRKLL